MLNIDTKLISKVIATRLKKSLNNLIRENQIAHLNHRFISEEGRLISDIVEITDLLHIADILLMADTEKASDSVNHSFLVSGIKKYGFNSDFIRWIKLLLQNKETCIINGE